MANLKSLTVDGVLIKKGGTESIGLEQSITTLATIGTNIQYESTNTCSFSSIAYDINADKIVVAYRDNTDAGKGKAVVGTVSSYANFTLSCTTQQYYGWMKPVPPLTTSSLSVGMTVTSGGGAPFPSGATITSIPNSETASGPTGASATGTFDLTFSRAEGIVWGTPVQFSTGETTAYPGGNVGQCGFAIAYDPDEEKVVIAWSEGDGGIWAGGSGLLAGGKGTSKVGTVSGTGTGGTISFGSEGIWETACSVAHGQFSKCMVYDTNQNKMVITWRGWGGNNTGTSPRHQGWASVGTVSGTGISWGTPVLVEPVNSINYGKFEFPAITYDAASQNIVIAWVGDREMTLGRLESNQGLARVGTVSGTTITFGTTVEHSSGYGTDAGGNDTDFDALSYDVNAQKILFCYQDRPNHFGFNEAGVTRVGTVSGTGTSGTVAFGKEYLFSTRVGDYLPSFSTAHYGIGYPAALMDICYNPDIQKHLISWMHNKSPDTTPTQDDFVLGKTATITSVGPLTCTTNSTTTVTTADTSSLAVGMSVSGTGMGVGASAVADGFHLDTVTEITSITNSTTFVISAASSASGTPSLTFTSLSLSDQVTIEDSVPRVDPPDRFDNHKAYDSVAKKMIYVRGDVNPSATMISFDADAIIIDPSTGSFFEIDLETASTPVGNIQINNVNATSSQVSSFDIKIIQGSTARQVTWSDISEINWTGGTPPTLTATNNAVDILRFTTYDNGTSWYGKVVGQNFS